MTCTTAVYDLSPILNYPIRVEVNSWDSRHPLHWVSYNDEGRIAEGQFLEPPGLPLFTLEDDTGRRLCDALPESVSTVAALMPAMDFELAQACATSEAARELANDAPLLFILAVDHARKQSWSLDAFNAFLAGKRSEILQAVGLPGSKSLVRLIRRLALSPLLPWELEDIHTALQNPDYLALMRHHPHLHLNHIRLLNRIRRPLWPGLLNLVDEHTSAVDMSWLCRMIRDTLAMAGRNEQVLAGIHSREALQAQHDRLVERFNRANSRNSEEKRQTAGNCSANPTYNNSSSFGWSTLNANYMMFGEESHRPPYSCSESMEYTFEEDGLYRFNFRSTVNGSGFFMATVIPSPL